METIVVRVIGFIAIIALGFIARTAGLLKREDAHILSNIVMNVTLPCALVSGMNGAAVDATVLVAFAMGFAANLALIFTARLRARRQDAKDAACEMLNTGGYNVGNFAIPFAASFFPASGLPFLCMFDAGNSIMCLGGTYSIVRGGMKSGRHVSARDFLRTLLSAVAFDTYMVLLALAFAGIVLPAPVVEVAGMIGGANSFLVMFMLGVLLDIHIDMTRLHAIARILTTRYGLSILFAVLVLVAAPLPLIGRQMVAVALCSPLSNMNAVFSAELGLDDKIPAAVATLSILISTALMSAAVVQFAA